MISIRTAGTLGIAGAAVSALSAAGVAFIVQPASDVSDEMWSYPWSSDALVAVSIVYTLLHVLVAVGLVGLRRTGAAGRVGPLVAIAGTVVLTAAELLSIPIAAQRLDDTGPGLVGALFGLGTVVSAVGLLIAGVVTIRRRGWNGWRRYAALATGIWTAVMIALINTPALAVAVLVYGALLTALFVAVATAPTAVVSGPLAQPARA
jgi:hypothetical protein